MAYIGNSPANVGNYQIVDDISSSFDGSETSFALTSGSIAITPAKSGQLLVGVNGVMQEPDDTGTNGFKVSSSNIVFSSPPASGDTFWSVYQGQAVDIGAPSDDVVDTVHIKDNAITAAKIADGTIVAADIASNSVTNAKMADDAIGIAELSATGTAGNTTFLRGDNSWVVPTDTNTVYTHPNHSGDVVSTADGATVIQVDAVDIPMLSATGTASSSTFLRGDNSWATAGSTSASDLTSGTLPIARIADGAVTAAKVAADVATQAELDTVSTVASAALPKAGGTMTGDIAHAGNFTINTDGNIALDNGSNNIVLLKDGAQYGLLTASSGNLVIKSGATTAITFANAAATFASTIVAAGNITSNGNLVTTNDVIFGANANGLAEEDGTIVRYKNTHSGGVLHLMTHDGNEDIEINPSGWMRFETAGSERMRITDNGTIGIGNSIPDSFDASADNLVVGTGSGNNGITIYADTSSNGGLYFADGTSGGARYNGWIDYDHNDNSLKVGVNEDNRIIINSSGNVGIGTASPDQKLHVAGNAVVTGITRIGDGSASSPAYQFVSDTNTGMFRIGSDQLGFSTAGGQAMMINAAGLVGIGINASANNLEVYKSAGASVRISSGANDSDAYLRVQSGNATGESYIAFGDEDDWDAGRIIYYNSTNDMAFYTGGYESMRINLGGDVGIGVVPETDWSSIIDALQVGNRGVLYSYNNLNTGLGANHKYTASGWKYLETGFASQYINQDDGSHVFNTAPSGSADAAVTFTTAMHILNNRSILIGTTNQSPAETNNVTGTRLGANGGCQFSCSGTTMVVNRDNSEGTAIELRQAGGFRGTIAVHGQTCSFNTTSDYRLKENVDYDWDATTRLKQLKPARFNFIADDTNTLMDGFIAHEVSSVVPEAITGEKDATEMQCIDQSKLVPLLVKTIQELEARITALEA
jgi:hypothetical protein